MDESEVGLVLAWVGVAATIAFGVLASIPPVRERWEAAWSGWRASAPPVSDLQYWRIEFTVGPTVWIGFAVLLVVARSIL